MDSEDLAFVVVSFLGTVTADPVQEKILTLWMYLFESQYDLMLS